MSAPIFRALVVDDDSICRKVVAFALEKEGFHCDVAADGVDALTRTATVEYDLVVTDLRMPNKHGHALSIELLSLKARPMLVVHSSICDPRMITDLMRRGIDDIIPKPTDYAVFAAKMLVLVERRRQVKCRAVAPASARSSRTPDLKSAAALDNPDPHAIALSNTSTPPHSASTPDSQMASKTLSEMNCLITRAEVIERIDRCSALKPMSSILSKLIKMLSAGACTAKEIAQTIKQDQALYLKVLKLANSPVYSRGDQVDSLEKAVLRIGTNQIRQSLTNIGIIEQFSSNSPIAGLDMRQFWEHSIAVGLIAAELTRDIGGKDVDADLAFTQGLFHDIGRTVLAEQLGETYEKVLTEAENLNLPLDQVETQLLHLNHADAAQRILTNWHFAKEQVQSLRRHHAPLSDIRKLPAKLAKETTILALANRMAHAMLLGKSGNEIIAPTSELAEMLSLPADSFSKLQELIPGRLDDLKVAMLCFSTSVPWPSAIDEFRKRILVPIRPNIISASAEHNSLIVLISQISSEEQTADEPANLSIVHIADALEIRALSTKLIATETASKTGPLPLLILSPGATLNLDVSIIGARRCIHLPSVTTIATFIDALMQLGH